jgi:hypothetical protein
MPCDPLSRSLVMLGTNVSEASGHAIASDRKLAKVIKLVSRLFTLHLHSVFYDDKRTGLGMKR